MVDFDLAAYLINVDASAAYLLAELDALCKRIDETLYNSRANLLVFENETLEVSGDDDEL